MKRILLNFMLPRTEHLTEIGNILKDKNDPNCYKKEKTRIVLV